MELRQLQDIRNKCIELKKDNYQAYYDICYRLAVRDMNCYKVIEEKESRTLYSVVKDVTASVEKEACIIVDDRRNTPYRWLYNIDAQLPRTKLEIGGFFKGKDGSFISIDSMNDLQLSENEEMLEKLNKDMESTKAILAANKDLSNWTYTLYSDHDGEDRRNSIEEMMKFILAHRFIMK